MLAKTATRIIGLQLYGSEPLCRKLFALGRVLVPLKREKADSALRWIVEVSEEIMAITITEKLYQLSSELPSSVQHK